MERFTLERRMQEARCPFCHGELALEDLVVSCGGCGTVHHADCLREELGSCASLGCQVRPELGRQYLWADHVSRAAKQGLTCCHEERSDDPIRICDNCSALNHTGCLPASKECCAGHETMLLESLFPSPSPLLPQTYRTIQFQLGLAGCLMILAGRWAFVEGFPAWIVLTMVGAGLLSLLGMTIYFMVRQSRAPRES